MKIKKILIFGATGFVGSSLKKKFLKTKKFKVIDTIKKEIRHGTF